MITEYIIANIFDIPYQAPPSDGGWLIIFLIDFRFRLARQLPGQPGVRELADGQRAVLHGADEHGAGGYSRVAAASRLIESGSCVGRYTTGSERTRAWMRPVVSR